MREAVRGWWVKVRGGWVPVIAQLMISTGGGEQRWLGAVSG
jgi:hypothetical protein